MGLDPGFGGVDNPPPTDVGLIADLLSLIYAVYNVLVAVANFLYGLIKALVGVLVIIYGKIRDFLKMVWENYIKKAIPWLLSHIQKVRDWLKRTIGPIIKRLEAIKRWYDEHILKQQLRLIRMIQTIRRFLGILRLFHIAWAAKLDNALADVQNRIQQEIAFIRGIFNQIINTLTLVLDPTLFVTRGVLGGTLLGNLGALKRIFGYGDNRILGASEQATIDRQHSLYFESTVRTHLGTLATSGPTTDDQDDRKVARQALTDAVNAPLPF
jgi:hypothetical protein